MNILAKIRQYFSTGYCFITLGEDFKEIEDTISPSARKLKVSAEACSSIIKKHNGNS